MAPDTGSLEKEIDLPGTLTQMLCLWEQGYCSVLVLYLVPFWFHFMHLVSVEHDYIPGREGSFALWPLADFSVVFCREGFHQMPTNNQTR